MFKYTVKRQLKQLPGNVTVFAAVQKDLDRAVEIRVLNHFVRTDSDEYLRFEREFKTIARLDHPNIIKVFDWGIANDKIYYVAEMKPAHAIDDLAKQGQANFTVQECLDMGRQVASAMAYLHKNNIVHRDITFSSINYQKEKKVAYIAHFSLVKNLNLEDLTARGVSHFQSLQLTPEKVLGMPVDHRTDVFLFGAFLYRLATGKDPLGGEDGQPALVTAETFNYAEPSSIRREIPKELDQIILKCIAKEPDDRFQTAADVVKELEKVIEEHRVRSKREATARMRAVDDVEVPDEGDDEDSGQSSPRKGRRGRKMLKSSVAMAAAPASNDEHELLTKLKEMDPKILLACVGGAVVVILGMLAMLIL